MRFKYVMIAIALLLSLFAVPSTLVPVEAAYRSCGRGWFWNGRYCEPLRGPGSNQRCKWIQSWRYDSYLKKMVKDSKYVCN